MSPNSFSQKNSVIGIVLIVVLGVVVYFGYKLTLGNDGNSENSVGEVDTSLFTPDISAVYLVKDKISLEGVSFINKPFYKKLEDHTVEIPTVSPVGRSNPFIPYASP